LLRRRQDSADAHFSLAYVFRYAGLLEESARECETSRRLDPRNQMWRSCTQTYNMLGRYDKVMEYVAADPTSVWNRNMTVFMLTRQGKLAEARNAARGLGSENFFATTLACLENRPKEERDELARGEAVGVMAIRDSEPKYHGAAEFARCGHPELALRLLRKAVEQNLCGYPAMDTEPRFASIRSSPEFAEIRKIGIACQQRFLAHRTGKTR
jgi:hypothetical protein